MASAPAGKGIGVTDYRAVWTGKEMLVVAGYDLSVSASPTIRAASYDPALDAWTLLADWPLSQRDGEVVVWSGAELIEWGGAGSGFYADGASFSAATRAWTKIATTGAPSARTHAVAVWSTATSEMIVWGGSTGGSTGAVYLSDGARFKPSSTGGTWSPMASPPPSFLGRSEAMAIWTGTKMLVFGGLSPGCAGTTSLCADAATYDPSTDAWTILPSSGLAGRWHGAEVADGAGGVLLWGGAGPSTKTTPFVYYDDGAIWSGTAFTKIPTTGAPMARDYPYAWFTGGKLFVWGGLAPSAGAGTGLADGAVYDPATSKWTALPTLNAPTGRSRGQAVWTGTEAIVWGGSGLDGKRYRP
jgi:N-acetylneuraminic acid mutarotase